MQISEKKEWKWHAICLGSLLFLCFGLFFILSYATRHLPSSHPPAQSTTPWLHEK